jgi:hypothetical protein
VAGSYEWGKQHSCLITLRTTVYEECRFVGCGAVWFYYKHVSEERVTSIFKVEEIIRARKKRTRLLTDWLQFEGHRMRTFVGGRWSAPLPRFILNPQGATSQETALLKVTAVKASNPVQFMKLLVLSCPSSVFCFHLHTLITTG